MFDGGGAPIGQLHEYEVLGGDQTKSVGSRGESRLGRVVSGPPERESAAR